MGDLTRSIIIMGFLLLPSEGSSDSHPVRSDALEILQRADAFRQEILSVDYDFRGVLRVVEADRIRSGLGRLSAVEKAEIEAIVKLLNQGRADAYRIMAEADENVRAEIELAAQNAASRARFEKSKRRQQLYFQLFQNIVSLAGSVQSYNNQQRINDLRGAPSNSRESMVAAYPDRSIASDQDFVSEGSGLPVEEIFNPLRGEPEDLDFFESFPTTYQQCVAEGFRMYEQMFPTWEGRMEHAGGLEGSQSFVQVGIYLDCGVRGKRFPDISPKAH